MEDDFELDQNGIYRLELLQGKLIQLIEAFNDFLKMDNELKWHQILSHFNILKVHYEGLFSELRQISEERQLVLPFNVPEMPQIVPEVLLRTRPLPEIESENEKLLALGNSIIFENELSSDLFIGKDHSKVNDAEILKIWESNMRMYDSMIECMCDIVRDDEDIRRVLKTRLDNLESKDSLNSKKIKIENDQKWLKKSLMWISSGSLSWINEEKVTISNDIPRV